LEHRLSIVLQTPPRAQVDNSYRELLQGYIYRVLREQPFGDAVHSSKYSLFTYQLFPIGGERADGRLISTTGTWILRIASAYEEILNIVEEKAYKNKITIGQTEFNTVLTAREPFNSCADFEVDSVLVFSKDKKFLLAWEPGYTEAVTTALAKRWEYLTNSQAPEIRFEFTEKPIVKKEQYKRRYLLTHSGSIHIESTPEMIKFVQSVGLGHKTSCGFGMVV